MANNQIDKYSLNLIDQLRAEIDDKNIEIKELNELIAQYLGERTAYKEVIKILLDKNK